MSILGYSTSYFLPEYWASTPLYGEKLIPLLDYILSNDYTEADKLSRAFYNLENKYKNTPNLPIDQIEAIIEESGYGYIRDLLGRDEDSIRLLTSLLVLIHDLKSQGIGIEVVLNLLKGSDAGMLLKVLGNPTISQEGVVSNITTRDFVYYTNFTTSNEKFEFRLKFHTDFTSTNPQCIASAGDKTLIIRIDSNRHLVLYAGNNMSSWNIADNIVSAEALMDNTTYYMIFSFDGAEYNLSLSLDNQNFTPAMTVPSSESLNTNGEILYIGVDRSGSTVIEPFLGSIDLGPITLNVDNVTLEQWFERTPVDVENTYIIKTELDITVISADFFEKFLNFAQRYVYPTLKRFEAKVTLSSNITFLPYTIQRVRYIAGGSANADTSLTPAGDTPAIEEFLKNYRYPVNIKFLTIQSAEELMSDGIAQTLTRYTSLTDVYFPNLVPKTGIEYEVPSVLEGRNDLTLHLPKSVEGFVHSSLTVSPTVIYDLPITED